eukprot:CAMPEP_0119542892 /NCGR_PEP_ID=MMETSP1344-20130328/53834_1 /TAXON_ID=236787 /ORGANISM="Florenciella parvula, Strain CCMP2471" /LENGTH=270 /DNA_ID=CAMNT_0007587155 /DNA_START=52 /DNA_END=864 /DNA_ORIENTATION=-
MAEVEVSAPAKVSAGFFDMGFELVKGESAEGKYEILGDDMQVLTLELAPDQVMISEPGTMLTMSDGVETEVVCDNCCARQCGGEPPINVSYTNSGTETGFVGFTPNVPAKILPMSLDAYPNGMNAQSGAYMSSIGQVTPGFSLDCNPMTACCAGMGCCRQKLTGDGVAFLNATGTVIKKSLSDGEVLVVDTHSLVAWDAGVGLGVQATGGMCVACFGGEGCCNTTLKGPGDVWIQSMNLGKIKRSLGVVITMKEGGRGGGAPVDHESMVR